MKPLTGRKFLVILLATFGIVFGVNGYMVAQSVKTFRGDDTENAYLQGADFNQALARRSRQLAVGWKASIDAQRARGGEVRITVAVVSRDDRPVANLRLGGKLKHPSDANRDRGLSFREQQAGIYAAVLRDVTTGGWDVVVHTGAAETPFEATRTIWLR